ncbi:hypothetical protein [Actinomadura violacea]|nr:hypothetical protein [Actinomadura violacea]
MKTAPAPSHRFSSLLPAKRDQIVHLLTRLLDHHTQQAPPALSAR